MHATELSQCWRALGAFNAVTEAVTTQAFEDNNEELVHVLELLQQCRQREADMSAARSELEARQRLLEAELEQKKHELKEAHEHAAQQRQQLNEAQGQAALQREQLLAARSEWERERADLVAGNFSGCYSRQDSFTQDLASQVSPHDGRDFSSAIAGHSPSPILHRSLQPWQIKTLQRQLWGASPRVAGAEGICVLDDVTEVESGGSVLGRSGSPTEGSQQHESSPALAFSTRVRQASLATEAGAGGRGSVGLAGKEPGLALRNDLDLSFKGREAVVTKMMFKMRQRSLGARSLRLWRRWVCEGAKRRARRYKAEWKKELGLMRRVVQGWAALSRSLPSFLLSPPSDVDAGKQEGHSDFAGEPESCQKSELLNHIAQLVVARYEDSPMRQQPAAEPFTFTPRSM